MSQRSFEPIYPNPYIAGNPIRSKEMFFGRVDEFRFIQRALEDGRKTALVVLYGERRSGKSSILYQIFNGQLGEAFLPLFVDMQIMAGISNDAEFFSRIITDTCKTCEKKNLNPDRYAIPSTNTNPAEVFRKFLEDLKSHFPHRALLLLLDEYEILEIKMAEGCLSRYLPAFFAGLLESEMVSFVLTGSRKLEARDQTLWGSGLLQKAVSRKISFLTEEDTARLVTQPLQNRVTFATEVVEGIYTLTAGQPFYTQMICQNLVYHLNEVEKYHVELEDLSTVVNSIIDNPPPQMIFNWGEHSPERKLALSLLAEFADAPGVFLSAGDICRAIAKHKLGIDLSKGQINSILTELFQDDYVVQKDRQYGFRLDLYRRWVRHDHNIWQVKKEIGPVELARITRETRKRAAKRKKRVSMLEHGLLLALGILVFYLVWRFIKPWILEEEVTIQANGGPFLVVVEGDTVGTTKGEKDSTKYVYKENLIKGRPYVFQAILLANGEVQSDTVQIGEHQGPVRFKFTEFPVTVVTDAASMIATLGDTTIEPIGRPEPWKATFFVTAGKYLLHVKDTDTGEEVTKEIDVSNTVDPIRIDFQNVLTVTLKGNTVFWCDQWNNSEEQKSLEPKRIDSSFVLIRGGKKANYKFKFIDYLTK
ncbi:MAG: ATP-binding protein, partial [candidate division KSB1 bacterium]|nr:ATP-binding protein [candidate division KSB1 bacterium]